MPPAGVHRLDHRAPAKSCDISQCVDLDRCRALRPVVCRSFVAPSGRSHPSAGPHRDREGVEWNRL